MSALVRYDAMCMAIANAHAVDEVKDIRDKALAIEAYARQAKNTDAEQKACEIRLRAERRAGQLLAEREKGVGARGNPGAQGAKIVASHATMPQSKPLTDLGISYDQSSRWQKLAAIPDADFEATFAQPGKKPSTTGLINAHQAPRPQPVADVLELEPVHQEPEPQRKPVDPRALWLWGRLLDFEREGILAADPAELFASMLDHMKEATGELAPVVAAWLGRIPA